jgi:hypothetical protein
VAARPRHWRRSKPDSNTLPPEARQGQSVTLSTQPRRASCRTRLPD